MVPNTNPETRTRRQYRQERREEISITNLIQENPYMRNELDDYKRYYRELVEKYFRECITFNVNDVVNKVSEDTLKHNFFTTDIDRRDYDSGDRVEECEINVRWYYGDAYELSSKIYSSPIERHEHEEEIQMSDNVNIYMDDLKRYAKEYQEHRQNPKEVKTNEYEKGIGDDWFHMCPFESEEDAICEELDKLRLNELTPFSQMSMSEIIGMNSTTVNNFLGRMIIYFESELCEILIRHNDSLQKCLDKNIERIIREMNETDNESCEFEIGEIRMRNEEFGREYERFFNEIVDKVMNKYSVSFTIDHVVKWYVDSGAFEDVEEERNEVREEEVETRIYEINEERRAYIRQRMLEIRRRQELLDQ